MSDMQSRHTLLESHDEAARVHADLRKSTHEEQPDAELFRPTQRPPVTILTVCDDGKRTGEVFRIRTNVFQIGRTEGDLCLPHDEQISSRHVTITRQLDGQQPQLVIEDLKSRNGVYFKIRKARLEHQAELLIGAGKYRFELPQGIASQASRPDNSPVKTVPFESIGKVQAPALVELLSGGNTSTTLLLETEYWIGQSKRCRIRRDNDVFVSQEHALLRKGKSGRWSIRNNKSINGVWLRMPKVTLSPGQNCDFRIGEQLFHLKFGV
ncbi:FHA domain-containing protein [Blastopirellula marina]|uniref:FHA domain-containing protein n=1 Tax=Blastopirellula marina TaxID=124 RepID=A0A2S8G2B8_9BACT|nr:FHA domain-containing protein [Blastopirellula marina]PQO38450.1 hypothetical protein C5Y98_10355 [Blastopirellula marina]PTL45107.1 hypothetical protein C5Y97_10365 [Blastopirellula marina]